MKTIKALAFMILIVVIVLNTVSCQSSSGFSSQTEVEAKPADGSESGDEMVRVLFLGNSLMYYNDMPGKFQAMAQAAGKQVSVDSVTQGSATMGHFADRTTSVGATTYTKLTKEEWDYVIIEPSRRITWYENTVLETEISAAKALNELANAAGAQVLIYSVWGNSDGALTVYEATSASESRQLQTETVTYQAHTSFMRSVAEKVSGAIGGAAIIDTGYAFENAMATNPEINLYAADLRHPSLEGSYLAACTIFSTMFGESTSGNSFTVDIPSAGTLQKISDQTVLNGLVPDLSEPVQEIGKEYNLLLIGSKLLDDYAMLQILGSIMLEEDGTILNSTSYLDPAFVFAMLADESTDLGVRKALEGKEWDAIILQLSRRNTASATDVAENETASLGVLMPLLLAQTPDVFILTLNSSTKPAIFSAQDNKETYDKTTLSEPYVAQEGTAYFSKLANEMATALGCKTILYGEAYHRLAPASKQNIGYLQACCLYYSLFNKEISDSTTSLNGLSGEEAASVRSFAKEFCLTR